MECNALSGGNSLFRLFLSQSPQDLFGDARVAPKRVASSLKLMQKQVKTCTPGDLPPPPVEGSEETFTHNLETIHVNDI